MKTIIVVFFSAEYIDRFQIIFTYLVFVELLCLDMAVVSSESSVSSDELNGCITRPAGPAFVPVAATMRIPAPSYFPPLRLPWRLILGRQVRRSGRLWRAQLVF
jgi:hypothetical protein